MDDQYIHILELERKIEAVKDPHHPVTFMQGFYDTDEFIHVENDVVLPMQSMETRDVRKITRNHEVDKRDHCKIRLLEEAGFVPTALNEGSTVYSKDIYYVWSPELEEALFIPFDEVQKLEANHWDLQRKYNGALGRIDTLCNLYEESTKEVIEHQTIIGGLKRKIKNNWLLATTAILITNLISVALADKFL